ncbi:MAG TPA: type II toxin-antitoxin system HicB family antitoxin [Anaerolineae bacterium]|nr:type II toxin-antitoxin system HicB family antitoxin [Anaerolineae bacterium]
MRKVLFKDDRHLIEAIERGRALRHAPGVPEPEDSKLGSVSELKEEWQRLRQETAGRNFYYVVIEPGDGAYRAYPLTIPEIVVQGETPQAAKRELERALHRYLADMRAQGKPLPVERKLVDAVVVPLKGESEMAEYTAESPAHALADEAADYEVNQTT